jgi:hypothetical protein
MPDIMLLPANDATSRYRPDDVLATIDGYSVYIARDTDRRAVIQFMVTPVAWPWPWSTTTPNIGRSSEIVLYRKLFRREDVFKPRERRIIARHGSRGRRTAKPVPMAVRGEIFVYATKDTPEDVQIRATEAAQAAGVHLDTVTVWRCPWWRRGAWLWAPPPLRMRF